LLRLRPAMGESLLRHQHPDAAGPVRPADRADERAEPPIPPTPRRWTGAQSLSSPDQRSVDHSSSSSQKSLQFFQQAGIAFEGLPESLQATVQIDADRTDR